jgi:hypothetical protein
MIRFFAVIVAIDGEGDADPAEEQFRFGAAGRKKIRRRRIEPALEDLVARPAAVAACAHLIEGNDHVRAIPLLLSSLRIASTMPHQRFRPCRDGASGSGSLGGIAYDAGILG